MKILSDNVITRSDLNDVDIKQTKQIKTLRIYVIASFVVNVVLSLALWYFA